MDPQRFANNPSGELVHDLALTEYGPVEYDAFHPNPLPPSIQLDWGLARTLSEADRALNRLAGLGINLPNPHLLSQAFIRREAVLSSRIEGTQTTIADLYAFEAGQLNLPGISTNPEQSDAREVANYVHAMELGLAWITEREMPVNLWLLRELHKVLLKGVRGGKSHPGEFRKLQNMIGEPNAKLQNARFIPPPVTQMKDALGALETYFSWQDDYPPLVRLAFIHYQFETIHPFEDGNGRIGRLLIPLLLVSWGILPLPLFNLSDYFEQRRGEYCDLLLAVSERSAWREWLDFFLTGTAEEARNGSSRAMAIINLQSDIRGKLHQARMPGLWLGVAEYAFERPILTAKDVETKFSVTHPTAINALRKLEDMGFLHEITQAERNKIFVAGGILDLLG